MKKRPRHDAEEEESNFESAMLLVQRRQRALKNEVLSSKKETGLCVVEEGVGYVLTDEGGERIPYSEDAAVGSTGDTVTFTRGVDSEGRSFVKKVESIAKAMDLPDAFRPTSSPAAEAKVGVVKWFDQAKKFGFIIAVDGTPDVFVHAKSLRGSILRKGDVVEYELDDHPTPKAKFVKMVRAVHPDTEPPPMSGRCFGTVKWCEPKTRKYGFIVPDAMPQGKTTNDIFFHAGDVVGNSSIGVQQITLAVGDRVEFTPIAQNHTGRTFC